MRITRRARNIRPRYLREAENREDALDSIIDRLEDLDKKYSNASVTIDPSFNESGKKAQVSIYLGGYEDSKKYVLPYITMDVYLYWENEKWESELDYIREDPFSGHRYLSEDFSAGLDEASKALSEMNKILSDIKTILGL